jgi:hypothetical protein
MLYIIDDCQRCIFVYLSGVVGDWELGTTAQRLWEETASNNQFARLIDGSNIAEWRAGKALVRAIASDVRLKSPSKVGMVAQTEPVLADFKIYTESLAGIPARVFERVDEAIEWLGVRLPEVWPPENA